MDFLHTPVTVWGLILLLMGIGALRLLIYGIAVVAGTVLRWNDERHKWPNSA